MAANQRVADLRVAAIEYFVGGGAVSAIWHEPSGTTGRSALGSTREILERVDLLREELGSTMALARGRVPRLREFAETWGRELVPAALLESRPDVLVVVPHSLLHDVPLHLVRTGLDGEQLGAVVGITYASGRSLFCRCVDRNPARARDPTTWMFPAAGAGPVSLLGGGADVMTGDHARFRALAASFATMFDYWDDSLAQVPLARAWLKEALRHEQSADVLCVVAHGYVDPGDQRLSGLLLELGPGVAERLIPLHGEQYFYFRDLPLRRFPGTVRAATPAEVLTAAELEVDARLETQLVVLLACSAGRGRVLQGDEPASLAESFLHVGAPSVLAPMWDSDYEATRVWMQQFFEGWVAQGLPKALATRNAAREMQDGPFADRPERLGALTLRGDWL